VRLDQGTGDRQAQAAARCARGLTVEAVEQQLRMLGVEAASGVDHRDDRRRLSTSATSHGDGDRPAGGRVPQRVVKEVRQHLPETIAVEPT
jgi:hypothetical protein